MGVHPFFLGYYSADLLCFKREATACQKVIRVIKGYETKGIP